MAAGALDRKIQQLILVAALFVAAIAVGIFTAQSVASSAPGNHSVAESEIQVEAFAAAGYEW